MSNPAPTATIGAAPAATTGPTPWIGTARFRLMMIVLIGIGVMSAARIIADNPDLTSSGTFGVGLRTAAPIALAGLSGLVAERSGTINIGLEGMMVMGTIFAGWWGWEFGPWAALLGGIVGGMLGGLLMSLATTTFGVNHIVAGVAINLIAPGVARFMASELFVGTQGGSVTSSPGNSGRMGSFTVPFLSGGDLFGWETPDMLGWLEDTGWFMIADMAGLAKGLTTAVTWDVVITVGLFFGITYLLWHMRLGLRLRFAGERPSAADSLGVSVHTMRWIGMAMSGALAGLGGAVLVLFANRYQENQVAGRGFLGLATMIFGNWMPAGTAIGAGLFGYAQGITLRTNPGDLVRTLLLAAAIGLALLVVWMVVQRDFRPAVTVSMFAAIAFWAYFAAEKPNNQLVFVTPFVVTLVAVSIGAQRLRPPAEEGVPWFKGMQ
jgi:general nucleoside transport system permease protein